MKRKNMKENGKRKREYMKKKRQKDKRLNMLKNGKLKRDYMNEKLQKDKTE